MNSRKRGILVAYLSESFFGISRREMSDDREYYYANLNEFEEVRTAYIPYYYNHKRIKEK